MKLYETTSQFAVDDDTPEQFNEFTSSASDASKVRTRLKKLKHEKISTAEVEIDTSRAGLIKFLNERSAHETWINEPTAAALS